MLLVHAPHHRIVQTTGRPLRPAGESDYTLRSCHSTEGSCHLPASLSSTINRPFKLFFRLIERALARDIQSCLSLLATRPLCSVRIPGFSH